MQDQIQIIDLNYLKTNITKEGGFNLKELEMKTSRELFIHRDESAQKLMVLSKELRKA